MGEMKVSIVTGAGDGIGRAVARALAKRGDRVYVIDINEDKMKEVCGEIINLGGAAVPMKLDVTKFNEVQEYFGKIESKEGSLDVLVNNVGGSRSESIIELTEDVWDEQILFNLKSVFNCIKAVTLPMMRKRTGRIVNMASVAGLRGGLRGKSAYMAAKAGVIGFTKGVARELAAYDITVNAVAPSMTASERMERLMEREDLSPLIQKIPLNRVAKPEEIAAAVVFLTSDEASYITGTVLCVDGGYSMH
jgi:NAD(P)-dependent dehydrogenase (short-subunit alcohol dehydrogenase family)